MIEAAASGDLAAYAHLVRAHQSRALRLAYVLTGDTDESQDIVQDAFVKAHSALHRFRSEAPFRPWLLAIVRNEALNNRRSRGRRVSLEVRIGDDPTNTTIAPSAETSVLQRVEVETLLAALDDLPDPQRIVIACRFLLDLSETETATVLGVSAGTIKSRTARGLQRLRRTMGDQNE